MLSIYAWLEHFNFSVAQLTIYPQLLLLFDEMNYILFAFLASFFILIDTQKSVISFHFIQYLCRCYFFYQIDQSLDDLLDEFNLTVALQMDAGSRHHSNQSVTVFILKVCAIVI
jgi:sensor histidine kinase YesM